MLHKCIIKWLLDLYGDVFCGDKVLVTTLLMNFHVFHVYYSDELIVWKFVNLFLQK